MNKIIPILLLLATMQACAPRAPESIMQEEPPKTIIHPKPLGDGGVFTRDLFRSFWMLPATDSEPLRVGIVPSAKTIRLRTKNHVTIRVYGEHESWDVA